MQYLMLLWHTYPTHLPQELADVVKEQLGGTSLYLVGMMGSGKSTMGKLLSQALGYYFFDLDSLVSTGQLSGSCSPAHSCSHAPRHLLLGAPAGCTAQGRQNAFECWCRTVLCMWAVPPGAMFGASARLVPRAVEASAADRTRGAACTSDLGCMSECAGADQQRAVMPAVEAHTRMSEGTKCNSGIAGASCYDCVPACPAGGGACAHDGEGDLRAGGRGGIPGGGDRRAAGGASLPCPNPSTSAVNPSSSHGHA